MYVRIARFEGGSADAVTDQVEEIKADVTAVSRGEAPRSMPPELTDLVSRVEMLVDREHGTTAMVVYCQTEEQVRRADEILNGMSPRSEDVGHRASVEIYELAFDQPVLTRKAA